VLRQRQQEQPTAAVTWRGLPWLTSFPPGTPAAAAAAAASARQGRPKGCQHRVATKTCTLVARVGCSAQPLEAVVVGRAVQVDRFSSHTPHPFQPSEGTPQPFPRQNTHTHTHKRCDHRNDPRQSAQRTHRRFLPISRRAGDRRHDGPVPRGQPVVQRRLPHAAAAVFW